MEKRMKYNGTFEVPCAYNGGGLLHERSLVFMTFQAKTIFTYKPKL